MKLGILGIIAGAFLALEIVGIVLLAGKIGGLPTVFWLLGAALTGGWLIRTAGAGFLPELMQGTSIGRDPFSVLWRVGRRFLAGMLLIFPGLVTDLLAVLLLLSAGLPRAAGPAPYGRQRPGMGPGMDYSTHRRQSPFARGDGDTIEGEFRRED